MLGDAGRPPKEDVRREEGQSVELRRIVRGCYKDHHEVP